MRIFWKRSEASKLIQSTIVHDVLYLPSALNLISLEIFSEKGSTFTCKEKDFLVYKENKLIFRGIRSKRVWKIPDVAKSAHSSISNLDILHERLGHPRRHITSRISKQSLEFAQHKIFNSNFAELVKKQR